MLSYCFILCLDRLTYLALSKVKSYLNQWSSGVLMGQKMIKQVKKAMYISKFCLILVL